MSKFSPTYASYNFIRNNILIQFESPYCKAKYSYIKANWYMHYYCLLDEIRGIAICGLPCSSPRTGIVCVKSLHVYSKMPRDIYNVSII